LFISTISSDRGELPPIIDLEDKYNENASNSKIIDTCKAVLDRVEKAFGVKPMIYSRTQYLNVHVSRNGKAPAWAMDYPLWLAQYPYVFDPKIHPNKNMPTQAVGWQDWKFWQYSETTIFEGVTNDSGQPTECDLNWFRGTEAELYAFANVKPKEPATHTVKAGDTFNSVAEKYKITVDELLAANPSILTEGTKLSIPVPTISKPIVVDNATVNKATASTRTHCQTGRLHRHHCPQIRRDRRGDSCAESRLDESKPDLCWASDRNPVGWINQTTPSRFIRRGCLILFF